MKMEGKCPRGRFRFFRLRWKDTVRRAIKARKIGY